ncbi:GNAT family N-acetyltransferase [Desulfomicrobium baculatum]|uniref:GCN5-related N-acetyltransferase n=1 Tax=Desulfomicrobium baculatum (strain DSM 4028 / VKM B-1378 / X) TaxID=525897 RepID=C7LVI5_DESBD|nr:GNAT family N-acetyltransferase [Desulfomicrobium baculatum]ACU89741.1 GCN5-related N-acetyltransferase [Desulfomicrobium baculatum DSM 4028]
MLLRIRSATFEDKDFVINLMVEALSPFYGGDHYAHAMRIFNAHNSGGIDKIGFFSLKQEMFIVELNGNKAGLLHLVLKRQKTCKISPLIVHKDFRGKNGIGNFLIKTAEQYAQKNNCRQLYCTVAEKNRKALGLFLKNNFILAGKSENHYKDGHTEYMLYKSFEHISGDDEFDFDHISVLPLDDKNKEQVKRILLEELPNDFIGINDEWVEKLFDGHNRRDSKDIDSKYKLIFTATDSYGKVLGVTGATPKKGEPIKLMPFVAKDSSAFFALLFDVPGLLREYGRKVYVHIVPDAEQVRFLEQAGWQMDGVMPDAYQVGIATQQWSKEFERDRFMRIIRLKKNFLEFIKRGKKTLEVRVGYDNIKTIKSGESIVFMSRDERLVRTVKEIRIYKTFSEMLNHENYKLIAPNSNNREETEKLLSDIYPPHKERLGVYVLDLSEEFG